MSTAPPPPTEAEDWAARKAEERRLSPETAALLTDLYVPGLPDLVEEFDREVAALPEAPDPLSWGVARRRASTGLDVLLERLAPDHLRRVLVWSFAARWSTTAGQLAKDPEGLAAWGHAHVQWHFRDHTPVWDTATLGLLIRAAGLGRVPLTTLRRALDTVAPADRGPLTGDLRAAADRVGERLRSRRAEEYRREELHRWLLCVLVDLGDAPRSVEELGYGGDRYFDLLRRTHPDLLTAPGVPALTAHLLRTLHFGSRWSTRRRLLDAVGDPADVVRRFLETALALPDVEAPAPSLTPEERRREGYPSNAEPRDSVHLTPHAGLLLEGMAGIVPLLPRETVPWAVDALERLARRLRSARHSTWSSAPSVADALASDLCRLGTEEAFHAVVRLRDQPGLDRSTRMKHQKLVERAARALSWTPDQTIERSVPAHGLAADGTCTTRVGAFTVVLALTSDGTEYTFTGPDGTAVRRAPKALRDSHPDELKELQRRASAMRRSLKSERERLAALAGSDRVWALPDWLPYYLRHPVTGPAARQVRWEAAADGVAWHTCAVEADGGHWRLVDDEGAAVLFTGRAAPDARIRPAGQVCG